MKLRIILTIAILSIPAVPLFAGAQELGRKWGSVELGGGPYIPDVDAEFGGGEGPYRRIFGGAPGPMFRIHVGKTIFQSRTVGALEVGFKTGFWSKSGRALNSTTHQPSGDRARFVIVPTSLTLTYRADFVYEQFRVPLIPYGRFTAERYNWWTSKEDRWTERGATNGWSGTVGVGLVIDWMDPDAARDLENEVGIAHTILYFDVTKSKVDDFGSDESWDLSEKNKLFWSTGLMVVF